MNKQEFVSKLQSRLKNMPSKIINDQISFYLEMIEDKKEEGLSEQEAIQQLGSIDDITNEIVNNISLFDIAKDKIKPKRKVKVLDIIFVVLTSPIWLSLFIAFLAVILAIYISMWAIVISFYAIFISLSACTLASLMLSIYYLCSTNYASGLVFLSTSFVLLGLSILSFYGCKYLTKCLIKLAKITNLKIKKLFIKKENNHEK